MKKNKLPKKVESKPSKYSARSGAYRQCPICPGKGVKLGTLGRRINYRCRDCGMGFSIRV